MKNNLPTVHMVVKNEDRFVFYAIRSVLPYAGKILICDTGSADRTVNVIKGIGDKKIILSEKKITDPLQIAQIRQNQIEETDSDWIWIVDGDEVYTEDLNKEIKKIIDSKGPHLEGIIVRRYDLLGDIYHRQSESVGLYDLFGQKGHFAIRLINKKNIERLHVEGIYPREGYYDGKGQEMNHHPRERFVFTENRIWHAMYLRRSSLGAQLTGTFHRHKYKIEEGAKINDKTQYPQVFFRDKPIDIEDVTGSRGTAYELLAGVITPIKKLKRRFI